MNNPFLNGAPAMPTSPMPAPSGNTAPNSPDSFEVDLTNVQSGFVIPDGKYEVVCTDIEQGVSKGGNPMFIWSFQIANGEHAGFEAKVFTAITPAAMWKVAETVQALGIGQTGETVKFKRSDVLQKHCGAIFEADEYNGQTRSTITKVISMKELKED